jgi:hypothetical protein
MKKRIDIIEIVGQTAFWTLNVGLVIGLIFTVMLLFSCSSGSVETRVKTFQGTVEIHKLNRLYKNGDTVVIRKMGWDHPIVTTGVVVK